MTFRGKEYGEYLREDSPRSRRVVIHLENRLEEVRAISRDPYMTHDYEVVELLDDNGNVVKRLKMYRYEYGIETRSKREAEIFIENAARKEANIIWERFGPDVAQLYDEMNSGVPTNRLAGSRMRPLENRTEEFPDRR